MALQDISDLLKDVRIEKIIPMDEELGRGAYGRVFTVKYCGLVCAAKEIHPILIEGVSPVERKTLIDNFIRECHRCSVIRHPNIVQFLGVYLSSKKSELPIMVMELMTTSLTSFVRNNQSKIPIKTKISILHDVSLGLSNLHSRNPVVIHRDLSPNNVMLTSQPVAKIGDLGVAKVIGGNSRQTSRKLTTAPGTVDFMPPETLEANPVYGTAVDVFSYAGICLHVFAEKWPTPIGLKRRDPVTKKLMALTEAERRQEYLEKIPGSVGSLKEIFLRCLDDDPEERPAIQEVSEMIKSLIKVASCKIKQYRLCSYVGILISSYVASKTKWYCVLEGRI